MNLHLHILWFVCILLLAAFVAVCIISFIENRRLTVTSYCIEDPGIPDNHNGLKIVQVSDMHNASFGNNNSRLFSRLRELDPDIIAVTGDILVGIPDCDVDFAAFTLNELSRIAPVYFSMGNHELRISRYPEKYGDMWERFEGQLSADVHRLYDSTETIERGGQSIKISGVTLTPKMYTRMKDVRMPKKHLKKRFGVCGDNEFHIFLAHNPDYFKDYANWGAKLTLSGHVHGGIMQIPFIGGVISPKLRLFPEYDKGLFEFNNKYMIISGGLGNHTLKFRINNIPEIVVVTLNKADVSKAYRVK